MMPGPTIIKKCSECSGLIQKHSIASGNTFGAIFWTDGKMDAPMLPDYPKLVKCPRCRSILWIDKLEIMEEVDPFETRNTDAKWPMALNLADYTSFLRHNRLLKPDVEKDVRMRAWWCGNDERRRGQQSNFSETEIQNLNALSKLMGQSNDSERLMKAEIMRELSDFDHSLELLDQPFDEQLSDAVTVIKNLAEQRDPFVAVINTDYD